MKKKRLLAAVLAIAILVVSMPHALLAAEGEDVTPLTSVNGEAITLTAEQHDGDYVFKNSSRVNETAAANPIWTLSSKGNINWDRASTYATVTNKNDNSCALATYGFTTYADNSTETMRWAYLALKAKVESNGIYDISAKFNINTAAKYYTLTMVVDGMLYSVDGQSAGSTSEPATFSTSLNLVAGEHIIVFSYPLTTDYSYARSMKENNTTDITWATNYHSITLDGDMSVLAAPTLDEVTASINNATHVEAEDSTYATLHGAYANGKTEDSIASGKYVVSYEDTYADVSASAITIETLESHLDKKSNLPYVEYKVTAPSDGTYNLRVGAYLELISGESTVMPKAVVLANDTVYESTYNNSWGDYNNAYFAVNLKKGENIIRTIGMAADMISDFDGEFIVNQDYIEFDNKLTVVPVTKGTTLEANNKDYVSSAKDTDASTSNYLYFSMADIRYDGRNVDGQVVHTAETIALDTIVTGGRIPHIKFSVYADHDGYYDISLGMYVNASSGVNTVAMFVDGTRNTKAFTQYSVEGNYPENTIVDVSTYLEKGEHEFVITTPMPLDEAEFVEVGKNYTTVNDDAKAAYPHACIYGMEFSSGITARPLSAALESYEAENAVWNGYYASDTDTTVGNVNWNSQTATYEEIVADGLDVTKTSFIQYKVTAPADGTYFFEMVGTYGETAQTTEITPFVLAVVNGAAQKLEIASSGDVTLLFNTKLQKGENTICITSPTKETAYTDSVWFNQDSLKVDPLLTFSEIDRVSATDGSKVTINRYTAKTSYVGDAVLDTLKANQYTIENISSQHLQDVPYVAVKVQADTAGYYDFNLYVDPADYPKISQQIVVMVDGQKSSASFMLARGGMLANLYLTEGEHVIVFTSPIPEDDSKFINTGNEYYTESDNETLSGNRTWPWLNYYSIGAVGVAFLDAPSYSEIIPVTGDINGDGVVDWNDMAILRKYLIGAVTTTVNSPDVNADTDVDIRDLVALMIYIKNDGIIYVSDEGSDDNSGLSAASAVKTLEKAISIVPDNGTIAIADTMTYAAAPSNSYGKTLTITGGTIDVSGNTEFGLSENITFENVTFSSTDNKMTVYANGYNLTMGEGVSVPTTTNVYGGTNAVAYIGDTSVKLLSGSYNNVYGGSYSADITGNTNLVLGVSASVNFAMGGSNLGDVSESANVTVQDGASVTNRIYGVSDTACEIDTANINVTGGSVALIYGGGKVNTTVNSVNVCISGTGKVAGNLYGGGHTNSTVNNTSVIVKEDAICTNVYGGGYQSVVSNNTFVTIQDNATAKEVYGGGRYKGSDVCGTSTVSINGGYVSGSIRGGAEGGDEMPTQAGNTVVNITGGIIQYHVYGAGNKSITTGTSTVNMSGGVIGKDNEGNVQSGGGNVYGGSEQGVVTNTVVNFSGGTAEGIIGGSGTADVGTSETPATVNINVTGGTINRRIIGGCYNDYKVLDGWQSLNYVKGTVTVTISEAASIVTSKEYDDYGISAASRIGTNYADEIACIKFTSEEAKTKFEDKIGLVCATGIIDIDYAPADDDGVYEIVG